jgi:CheY-like chemotaxis protein
MLTVEKLTQTLSSEGTVKAPRRILVVEDDPHSREGLRGLLSVGGYWVDTAADGWQAIERIKDGSFQLALVDLDLPVVHGVAVDGWDLVRILRAFHPDITIIVVSAQMGPAIESRARVLKVSCLLEKPLDPATLWATLRRLDPSRNE